MDDHYSTKPFFIQIRGVLNKEFQVVNKQPNEAYLAGITAAIQLETTLEVTCKLTWILPWCGVSKTCPCCECPYNDIYQSPQHSEIRGTKARPTSSAVSCHPCCTSHGLVNTFHKQLRDIITYPCPTLFHPQQPRILSCSTHHGLVILHSTYS